MTRCILLVGLLLRTAGLCHAADATGLICLTEQPAINEGRHATLKVWASTGEGLPVTGLQFDWTADAGRVEGPGATPVWNLSGVTVQPGQDRKVVATVKATAPGAGTLSCAVEVRIGRAIEIRDRGVELISAKHYLLPGKGEDEGYGLYSYLLFSAPPKDAQERERYLKTIEACLLMLQDVDEYLSRHLRLRSLNVTYLPLKAPPAPGKSSGEDAANVLAVYDYAQAQILLGQLGRPHERGPYLVSVLSPLSLSAVPVHLWEDLSGVVPELAWDWIRFFTYLAAQERTWSDESLQRLGLNLRNLIAVGGKVTPDTAKALRTLIRYAKKD